MTKTRKTKRPSFDDSDESDFEGNYSNKQRKANWDIESQLSDMEGKLIQIEMRVDETRSDINKVISLTKDSHVPLAIKNIVQESFSCLICKTAPMNTPVIASRCCGVIIGCSTCVDTWYGTEASIFDKTCSHCRGERAYSNTLRLLGIDDFFGQTQRNLQQW